MWLDTNALANAPNKQEDTGAKRPKVSTVPRSKSPKGPVGGIRCCGLILCANKALDVMHKKTREQQMDQAEPCSNSLVCSLVLLMPISSNTAFSCGGKTTRKDRLAVLRQCLSSLKHRLSLRF